MANGYYNVTKVFKPIPASKYPEKCTQNSDADIYKIAPTNAMIFAIPNVNYLPLLSPIYEKNINPRVPPMSTVLYNIVFKYFLSHISEKSFVTVSLPSGHSIKSDRS